MVSDKPTRRIEDAFFNSIFKMQLKMHFKMQLNAF